MTLDEEIARVAKLRGMDLDSVKAHEQERQFNERVITLGDISSMLNTQPGADEWRAYEALPKRLRAAVRDYPFHLSAAKVAALLGRVASIVQVVEALDRARPHLVRAWAINNFGKDHPRAKLDA